jgi:hypothetical protein
MSDLQEKGASQSSALPASEHPQKETVSTGKRSLLKYGWSAPLIVAVTLPKSGFAANISGHSGDSGGKGKGHGKDKDIVARILAFFGR